MEYYIKGSKAMLFTVIPPRPHLIIISSSTTYIVLTVVIVALKNGTLILTFILQ